MQKGRDAQVRTAMNSMQLSYSFSSSGTYRSVSRSRFPFLATQEHFGVLWIFIKRTYVLWSLAELLSCFPPSPFLSFLVSHYCSCTSAKRLAARFGYSCARRYGLSREVKPWRLLQSGEKQACPGKNGLAVHGTGVFCKAFPSRQVALPLFYSLVHLPG